MTRGRMSSPMSRNSRQNSSPTAQSLIVVAAEATAGGRVRSTSVSANSIWTNA